MSSSSIIQLRTALKRQITSSTFNEEEKNVQGCQKIDILVVCRRNYSVM